MVVTVQCNQCGKDFRQARHLQRFCTTQCHDVWHRHQHKLEAVRDAEAVRDVKKQLHKQIDGMQIVEAIKYGRPAAVAPAVAENGMRRRVL
jgi:hypothetical protein